MKITRTKYEKKDLFKIHLEFVKREWAIWYLLNSFISLSFLFIWTWNDKYVHTLRLFPPKQYQIPDQNGQQYTRFKTGTLQKPYLWGSTYRYGSYKEIPSRLIYLKPREEEIFHKTWRQDHAWHYSFNAPGHLQWDEMFFHQTTNSGKTAFGSIIKSTVKKEKLVPF